MLQMDAVSAGSGRMSDDMLMGMNRDPDGAGWQEVPA
jgi:hypothetical protein